MLKSKAGLAALAVAVSLIGVSPSFAQHHGGWHGGGGGRPSMGGQRFSAPNINRGPSMNFNRGPSVNFNRGVSGPGPQAQFRARPNFAGNPSFAGRVGVNPGARQFANN